MANLSYLDLGDAPVTSPDLPVLGEISGSYSKRDTIYLQISGRVRWQAKVSTLSLSLSA